MLAPSEVGTKGMTQHGINQGVCRNTSTIIVMMHSGAGLTRASRRKKLNSSTKMIPNDNTKKTSNALKICPTNYTYSVLQVQPEFRPPIHSMVPSSLHLVGIRQRLNILIFMFMIVTNSIAVEQCGTSICKRPANDVAPFVPSNL